MRRLRRDDNVDDVLDQMQDFFNQFQDFGRDMAVNITSNVPVDIREDEGQIVIAADLPGVQKEEINVKADAQKVEIMAESSEEVKEENEKYLRRERSSRKFQRTVAWPREIDADSIEAEYKDGVLEVSADLEGKSGKDIEVE